MKGELRSRVLSVYSNMGQGGIFNLLKIFTFCFIAAALRPSPTRFFQNRDFVPNMQNNNNNNNKSLVPKKHFPDKQSNRGTIRRTVGIRKDHLRDSFAIPAQQGRPFSTTKTPTLSSPPTGTRRTMAALTCWPSP